MERLVLFGTGHLSRRALLLFREVGRHEPVAFTVERAYLDQATFEGLPVVAFEELVLSHPPGEHSLCVAAGPHGCNGLRQRIHDAARERGYAMASAVSPGASVAAGVEVGAGSLVMEGCLVEPGVRLGVNAVLWSGALIAHDTIVGDHVYFAPRVAVSGCCRIGDRSFIGTNATLRDHVELGAVTLVGCGAVIQGDTEPGSIYPGPRSIRRDGESADVRL